MNTRHDNADGPEDIDAAFAEIVAGLERDAPLGRWPDTDEADREDGRPTAGRDDVARADSPTATDELDSDLTGPRNWSPPQEADDEGHYEPPEPPPLPAPRPATLGGVVLIVLGVLLLVVPGALGVASTVSLPLGLVAISGGISWLLLRMRNNPPNETDDGAQL
jgi:hypothetical protein